MPTTSRRRFARYLANCIDNDGGVIPSLYSSPFTMSNKKEVGEGEETLDKVVFSTCTEASVASFTGQDAACSMA